VAHDATKIISSSRQQAGARLSPDASKVVFASDRNGGVWNLWLANQDGTNPHQMTYLKMPGSPAWSPDGKQIAFDYFDGPHSDIYVMDSAGGPPQRKTDGHGSYYMPFWSNDGEWLYFASLRSGRQELWRLSLSNGSISQFTHGGAFRGQSAPVPWIYFWREGGIWRMPENGGVEEFVAKCAREGAWAAGSAGVYFYDPDGPAIRYMDLATRRITPVLDPAMRPFPFGIGISLSSDETTLIYVGQERIGSEIRMLDLH
jgi:hypothetical protein